MDEYAEKIQKFCMDSSLKDENLFVKKLRAAGLLDVDICAVIDALESTCSECLDSETPCYCWNDA